MKRYVIGDIHGGYKALIQCLERSNFDYENDLLIQLGDVVDGWSEVYECVEELLKIKNLIAIKGNHDDWFTEWLKKGVHPVAWMQGGEGTLKSYCNKLDRAFHVKMSGISHDLVGFEIPTKHYDFFMNKQIHYFVDSDNNLFVHAGFNRHFSIEDKIYNSPRVLMWDRDLWSAALSYSTMPEKEHHITGKAYKFKMYDNFKEVFIGHTATINWDIDKPMKAANIWNLDTGGGYKGKLTIMNIDTKEYWQSDNVNELYINEIGRS